MEDIFVSPPQSWDSLNPSIPLFKDKMGGTLKDGQQITKGPQDSGIRPKGCHSSSFADLRFGAVRGFSTEPQFLSFSVPVGLSRSFLLFSSHLWLDFPWGSRDLIMMASYRRLTTFFTKGFQWIIYRRPLSPFTRAEIPLRNNSEKRKMRHFQALSSGFLTTKLWQWILLKGVISLQAAILCH